METNNLYPMVLSHKLVEQEKNIMKFLSVMYLLMQQKMLFMIYSAHAEI